MQTDIDRARQETMNRELVEAVKIELRTELDALLAPIKNLESTRTRMGEAIKTIESVRVLNSRDTTAPPTMYFVLADVATTRAGHSSRKSQCHQCI